MARGQVMILTTLALGGTILGATTIAGLLMAYQLRQTNDFTNSAKAIFAADAGIECGLYQFFKEKDCSAKLKLGNGASYTLICKDENGHEADCKTFSVVTKIQARGDSAAVSRALEFSFRE